MSNTINLNEVQEYTGNGQTNMLNFKNAIITDVKLKDGTVKQIVTFFNADSFSDHEEIALGVKVGLAQNTKNEFVKNYYLTTKTKKIWTHDIQPTLIDHKRYDFRDK